jgi:hypothetical protein
VWTPRRSAYCRRSESVSRPQRLTFDTVLRDKVGLRSGSAKNSALKLPMSVELQERSLRSCASLHCAGGAPALAGRFTHGQGKAASMENVLRNEAAGV